MDDTAFEKWLLAIGRLDAAQRGHVLRALALAESGDPMECPPASSEAAISGDPAAQAGRTADAQSVGSSSESLMAEIGWGRINSFGCPHCGVDDARPWGSSAAKPRYRCAGCRKTFNPLTGTPLAGLHYQDRWKDQAQALIVGETVSKAAKRCGVAYTTAFRWRHRFLSALNLDKPQRLSGIVEADETFVLESFKGKRGGLGRVARKRGGKASKRGLSSEQIPVIVARDRSGATIDAVLPRLDAASMTAALGQAITNGVELCCDGGMAITAFARRARVKFHVLPAPGAPKPDAPQFHINNVNAYHGRFKEWMRRFHGVATDNLPSYLSWRRTIEAFSTASLPEAWIMGAAGLGPYQQRTT